MCSPICQHFCRPRPRNMHTIIMDKFRGQNRPTFGPPKQQQQPCSLDASYISEDEWNFIRSFSGEMFKNYLLMRQLQKSSGLSSKVVRWLLQEDLDTPIMKKVRKNMKVNDFVKDFPNVPFTKTFDCFEEEDDVCVSGECIQPLTKSPLQYAVAKAPNTVWMPQGVWRLRDEVDRYVRLQQAMGHAGAGTAFNGNYALADKFRKIFGGRNMQGTLGAQALTGRLDFPEYFGVQRVPVEIAPLQLLRLGDNALTNYMGGVGFQAGLSRTGAAGDFATPKTNEFSGAFAYNRGNLSKNERTATIGDFGTMAASARYGDDLRFMKDGLTRSAYEDAYGLGRYSNAKYMDPQRVAALRTAAADFGRYSIARELEARKLGVFEKSEGYAQQGGAYGNLMDPQLRGAFKSVDGYERFGDTRQGGAFQTANIYDRLAIGMQGDPGPAGGFPVAVNRHIDHRQGGAFQTVNERPMSTLIGGRFQSISGRSIDPRRVSALQTADIHERLDVRPAGGLPVAVNRQIDPRQGDYERLAGATTLATADSSSTKRGRASLAPARLSFARSKNTDYNVSVPDPTNARASERLRAKVTRSAYRRPDWNKMLAEERTKYQNIRTGKEQSEEENFQGLVEELNSFYSVINEVPPPSLIDQQQQELDDKIHSTAPLNLTEIVEYLKRNNHTFYPVTYHEPFDRHKPWTWMQKFPAQIPETYLERVSEHSLAALKAWQRFQSLMVEKPITSTITSVDVEEAPPRYAFPRNRQRRSPRRSRQYKRLSNQRNFTYRKGD